MSDTEKPEKKNDSDRLVEILRECSNQVSRERIFAAIDNERIRQERLWGEQNHRDGTDAGFAGLAVMAKEMNTKYAAEGALTWGLILLEEVAEALESVDERKLREELTQVAAVAVAWLECLDRRRKKNHA